MSRSNKYIERSTFGIRTIKTMQDELLGANNTKLEYTNGCQDPFDGQDPYNRAIKLLATICSSELEHNNTIDGATKRTPTL